MIEFIAPSANLLVSRVTPQIAECPPRFFLTSERKAVRASLRLPPTIRDRYNTRRRKKLGRRIIPMIFFYIDSNATP